LIIIHHEEHEKKQKTVLKVKICVFLVVFSNRNFSYGSRKIFEPFLIFPVYGTYAMVVGQNAGPESNFKWPDVETVGEKHVYKLADLYSVQRKQQGQGGTVSHHLEFVSKATHILCSKIYRGRCRGCFSGDHVESF
jgi:hypothetical protein